MVIFNSYVKLPEGNLKQFMHDWDWTTWQQFCGNWKSSVQRERTGKYQQFLEKNLGKSTLFHQHDIEVSVSIRIRMNSENIALITHISCSTPLKITGPAAQRLVSPASLPISQDVV